MNPANSITLSSIDLTRFLFALILLLFASHSIGYIFQKIKLPRVIGEIMGGLLLGPTFLGFLSPSVYNWIFNVSKTEGSLLASIYWLGLVLLMFISGFEMQNNFNKKERKLTIALLIGGTAISFLAGWFMPNFYNISNLIGIKQNFLALKLVIGIAIAVTSIPVISKIFLDLNIINTRFAKIVLAVATLEDVMLYALLAVATGLVTSSYASVSNIAFNIVVILVFFLFSLIALPKLFHHIHKSKLNTFLKSSGSGYVLLICFLFAALANLLNINIVFGALLAGILLKKQLDSQFKKVKATIKDISLGFFVPVYFAIVGLKLDLLHNFDIKFFIGFLIFATIVKTIGTIIAAKISGEDLFSSFNLGVVMNTRGGPGIVLATVAFDMGIINENFFASLIMLSIITSLMSGSWFKYILSKKWELLKNN